MCHAPKKSDKCCSHGVVFLMQTVEAAASATEPTQLLHSERGRKDHIFFINHTFEYKWVYNGAVDPIFTDSKPIIPFGW
jgi:hypothetical protein